MTGVPTLDPIFGQGGKKRSQIELSKALASMGFSAWNDLEPSGIVPTTMFSFSLIATRPRMQAITRELQAHLGQIPVICQQQSHLHKLGIIWFVTLFNLVSPKQQAIVDNLTQKRKPGKIHRN